MTPDPVSATAAAEVLDRAAACDLVMLVPSRGRPAAMAELIEQWDEVTSPRAALVLAVDVDDPELPGYLALGHPLTIVGPRLRLGGTLNVLAPAAARLGAFAVGFMGDDHRPRTTNWDRLMVNELRRVGSGVAYGDDLFQHERIPTAVVITGDILDQLGFMVPPGMIHLYLDDFWLRLGTEIGRLSYLPDVVIEHMHPAAGKGDWDQGYQDVNSARMYEADHHTFQGYLGTRWPIDRDRLIARLSAAASA